MLATDPAITHIKEKVDNTRQPGDWTQLNDALGSRHFKVIVGDYSFPYWSDLGIDIHYQPNSAPQTTLSFPEDIQATFRQVIEHLNPNGTFVGNTKMLYEEWIANPHLEAEVKDFFASLNCDLIVRKGTQTKAHNYEFVVFQVTRR